MPSTPDAPNIADEQPYLDSQALRIGRTKGLRESTRITGIDLARALALMGMMAAHFGASNEFGKSFWDSLGAVTHGRSSILFAVVAGVSIALMTGRTTPVTGNKIVQARIKLVIRALFIAAIGSALTTYGSGIDIILQTYALLFIIAIPFLRVRRRTLLLWAAGFATIGSVFTFAYRPFSYSDLLPVPFPEFLSDSSYALLPWCALVLIGMAIGRTNLTSWRNLVVIGGAGVLVATLAYGSTTFVEQTTTDERPAAKDTGFGYADTTDPFDSWITTPSSDKNAFMVNSQEAGSIDLSGLECEAYGDQETNSRYLNCWETVQNSKMENYGIGTDNGPVEQLTTAFVEITEANPHSGSPSEILGGAGVAAAIIALCVAICSKAGRAFALFTALGSMPLTVYTMHVLTFKHVRNGSGTFEIDNWVFSVLGFAVFAWMWLRYFKRGPLESLMALTIKKFLNPGTESGLPPRDLPISASGPRYDQRPTHLSNQISATRTSRDSDVKTDSEGEIAPNS